MNHISEFGLPKKRKKTIDLLEKAFAEGDLDQHDYEHRLEVALAAKSKSELDDVLSDFPSHYKPSESFKKTTEKQNRLEVNQDPNKLALAVLSGRREVLSNVANAPSRFFTLLGDTKVTVKSPEFINTETRFETINVLGETTLDLRDKCLEGAKVNLRVMCTLGEIILKVAPGTQVIDQTHKILSENSFKKRSKNWSKKIQKVFSNNQQQYPDPSIHKVNCTVVVEGYNILGSLRIMEYDV
ncbi:DUF1707 domain-containing protein [Flammeovirga yaeyamensis]|uniref:DUF1707 domain-containing protein n=1 Tax=Flammeovirga yaeyamensis TaxID=367791 RepID=A0AAX1N6V2_9BACT|nr:DUF1707 domain-containing protein [Flammeovirga yaeyamensis]MBB3697881.1 hypothetical protein [Flammeovirga yaeyamensis]NMF35764.1 DUF1707 domain-containing protein [Flammeovirga yaeyamensis]QWG03284.1 DUF1707 domain-containing protein [Flammeovirga yaeyamensis]